MKLSLALAIFLFGVLASAIHQIPVSNNVPDLENGIQYEAENAFKNVKSSVSSCKFDDKKVSGTVAMLSTESYIIFTVNIASDGIYPVTLFAQSCDQSKTLVNIHANGHPQMMEEPLDLTAGAITHDLSLRFGLNTISYMVQGGSVAIDRIVVKGGIPMAPRGATVQYEEIEAEASNYQGYLIGPDRAWCSLPSEASGRQAVQLNSSGNFVEFTPTSSFNAIVVRFSIPNTEDGVGQAAELNLLVNGNQATTLNVTSYYSWTYGSYPFFRVPSQGNPHHFYDDVRFLFSQTYPSGTKVRLIGASPITYTIDLADFYTVPAPYSMPSGFISVIDHGADPTGTQDSAPAFQETIEAAVSGGHAVWIPQGKFHLTYRLNMPNSITIRGAGPWYTELWGHDVGFDGQQSTGVQLFDYAVFGTTNVRVDSEVSSAVGSSLSSSLVQNLWIEHDKCGMWLDGPFDSLMITGVTIRNTFADGVNFHQGVTNSVVEQSVIRNTGDDGLAMWPQQPQDYHSNTFKFNTVSLPMLANTIAIYGGSDNSATDNYCADTVVEGAGLQTGTRFGSVQLGGQTTFARNTLVRTGSPDMYNPSSSGEGCIWIYSDSGPISTGGLSFDQIDISDAYYQIVMFYQGQTNNVSFTNINADGAEYMWEERTAGSIYAANVVATNVQTGIWNCGVPFTITQGPGNSGWDSTKCS